MTLLALLLTTQAAATAADFFPLVPGERRIYESKKGDDKMTYVDEVGARPAAFDGAEATPILQKSQFNQVLGTQYYRVDGASVLLVGSSEERSSDAKQADGTVDFSKPRVKRTVLMQLVPAMPVFKYDGHPTTWLYGEIPMLKSTEDKEPVKTDETSIKGTSKLGAIKTVLGRKVETLEVRAEVQLGSGALAQKIVETSIYGRGIGLIEAVRKESGGGKKASETRTTLIGLDKKEGG